MASIEERLAALEAKVFGTVSTAPSSDPVELAATPEPATSPEVGAVVTSVPADPTPGPSVLPDGRPAPLPE